MTMTDSLEVRCRRLRSLHRPGTPLVLPNAWDAATAAAVVAAGFPVVATTSAGIAVTLGYEDHERAPAAEMLAAAARISASVELPVSIDAEAGYGMRPTELVAALEHAGAAGCNLEDTDHASGRLRDPTEQAAWLQAVRQAASDAGYQLVINARIDLFLSGVRAGAEAGTQQALVPAALERAHAYHQAGADCVYPIGLSEPEALRTFTAEARVPVNALAMTRGPSLAELAQLGLARVSYGSLLHRELMKRFGEILDSIAKQATPGG